MKLSEGQFQQAHQDFVSDGGFSIDRDGNRPTTGYAVSLPGELQLDDKAEMTHAKLNEFAGQRAADLSQPDHYLGGWGGDRGVSIDVSKNIKAGPSNSRVEAIGARRASRKEAMALARTNNQEAIYDIDRGKTITNRKFKAPGS